MPYRNPERKRQWGKAHRELRNAQRRAQRSGTMARRLALDPEPNAVLDEPQNGWQLLLGLAVGFVGAEDALDHGAHPGSNARWVSAQT